VANLEAARRAHRTLPAGAVATAAAGVEANTGDRHVDVAGVGVERDPLALTGAAVVEEAV